MMFNARHLLESYGAIIEAPPVPRIRKTGGLEKIVVKLNGDYPSFKNYVWTAQHILNGGTPNNQVDELVMEKLKLSGRL